MPSNLSSLDIMRKWKVTFYTMAFLEKNNNNNNNNFYNNCNCLTYFEKSEKERNEKGGKLNFFLSIKQYFSKHTCISQKYIRYVYARVKIAIILYEDSFISFRWCCEKNVWCNKIMEKEKEVIQILWEEKHNIFDFSLKLIFVYDNTQSTSYSQCQQWAVNWEGGKIVFMSHTKQQQSSTLIHTHIFLYD